MAKAWRLFATVFARLVLRMNAHMGWPCACLAGISTTAKSEPSGRPWLSLATMVAIVPAVLAPATYIGFLPNKTGARPKDMNSRRNTPMVAGWSLMGGSVSKRNFPRGAMLPDDDVLAINARPRKAALSGRL